MSGFTRNTKLYSIGYLTKQLAIVAATILTPVCLAPELQADLIYSYGHPQTPLDDGYIVSYSNASIYSEGTVRAWKPNVGGTTFANTTPGVITMRFDFDNLSESISLFINMPTFHWSYSRGHNFLFGSTDGNNWLQMAEVTPPSFGSFNNLGSVNVPTSLIGSNQLWLRIEMYSYGTSAPSGGVWTNTAQFSRFDVGSQNTSFSLSVTTVPEPTSAASLIMAMIGGLVMSRRIGFNDPRVPGPAH
jgi:hypothetical protein